MNPAPDEREKRLIEVFNEARDLPAGEQRDQFLEKACGKDEHFRAELHSLLRAGQSAGDYLHGDPGVSPQLEAEFARLKPEEPGDRIGHYKLLQQIGEGGFGTVWMAEQSEPVKRRVALKIIKLGMDTKEVVARFEQERQALALMDHPNIARVFDAGVTPTGRPFFVMELVRGIKITDYCDEQSLSTEDRVQLFIEVCHAVQHAHQKGIIHRDLKPSNILITINDGEAVPKVIDFGVAKATQGRLSDATLFTKFEQMIGTPLYMSPEQAEMTSLDIDTRSDIFSLGVLLYELLTGRTPIDTKTMAQAGMDEIRRLIREVDPPRPSARVKTLAGNELTTTAKRRHTDPARLPRSLRGDIDWIVMKCLEKDRKRRYETATGLAADLKRHLRNEVVIARPPTTAYLLGKLIKRNKLAFAAGVAIAVSVIAGMVATGWQLVQTRKAEQRVTATLDELKKTAPAFAEQARALAAAERYDEAIQKLEYASELRPDAAEYLVAKGDLLQCQVTRAKLSEAATVYRQALQVQPGHAKAEASAKMCEEILAAKPAENGKLTRESLARLHLAMQQQQRPAAELMPVARLLGDEKKLLVDYWAARLKDLPVAGEKPLDKRLTVQDDGRLALDLSSTKVVDLAPLAGAPLAVLNLGGCEKLADISPLRGLQLTEVNLTATQVQDLSPLAEMRTLEKLYVAGSHVTDLSPIKALRLKTLNVTRCAISDLAPIRGMPLEELILYETRVADITPLSGMPIKHLDLSMASVLDFAPLATLPLEKCYLQRNRITDLSVFRGKPLKELVLLGCGEARNFSVLSEIPTLELLLVPTEYRTLPWEEYSAIGALRRHPKLRQIGAEVMGGMLYSSTGPKDVFWQDWDREQSFVPRLRASGFNFALSKLPGGSYAVYLQSQKGFRDLSILAGAPIKDLYVSGCDISDLSPLRGLSLRNLGISYNPVRDLSPLRGMQLEDLDATGTSIADLSPLLGAPLKRLCVGKCERIGDLGILANFSTLEKLTVPVGAANLERLRELRKLTHLSYELTKSVPFDPDTSVAQFWKDYEANGWIAPLAAAGWRPKELKRLDDDRWDLNLDKTAINDLSLLSGAPIGNLHLTDTAVSDLSPLRGMKLRRLWITNTRVTDLEPLRGMPLKEFRLNDTRITDLRPLAGMPLETLDLSRTKVSDISALRGMPVTTLRLHGCDELTDLAPIAAAKSLTSITLPPKARDFEFLRGFPKLQRIGFNETSYGNPDKTAVDFWKEYDGAGWLHKLRVAGLKPNHAKQLADGSWDLDLRKVPVSNVEILRGARMSKLHLGNTGVTDLEPLRGMPLKHLTIYGTKVADLRPLQGMSLEYLHAGDTKVNDISVLRGMPLHSLWLHHCPELTDVSPLAEAKNLTTLTLPAAAANIEFLRSFTNLEYLAYSHDPGGKPATTATQFWKEYEKNNWSRALEAAGFKPNKIDRKADGTWSVNLNNSPIADLEILRGAPISELFIGNTRVTDLSPLRGMPLERLSIYDTNVSDLRPLAGMPLWDLHMSSTPVNDISPLRGMPLQSLKLHICKSLRDLSPLVDARKLTELTIPQEATDIDFLRKLPALKRLAYRETDGRGGPPAMTVAEFWAEHDEGWRKTLRASGFEPSNAARLADGTWEVSLDNQKIADLNLLRGAPISKLHLGSTLVTDLSPLRGMRLTHLWVYNTKVSDLRPLEGMPLEWLHVSGTPVKDISIARKLPLKALRLHDCKELHDISPLKDVKGLTTLTLPRHVTDIEFLRGRPELEWLGYWSTFTKAPDQSAVAFWKDYDAKKKSEADSSSASPQNESLRGAKR